VAWDDTVPDTHAESHIGDTATEAGAAASLAATNKIAKYDEWPFNVTSRIEYLTPPGYISAFSVSHFTKQN